MNVALQPGDIYYVAEHKTPNLAIAVAKHNGRDNHQRTLLVDDEKVAQVDVYTSSGLRIASRL